MKDYTKLKELLKSEETFPLRFTYKFIGRNTPAFAQSSESLVKTFPTLQLEGTRESGGGKHMARTYSITAPNADLIIEIFRAIEKIDDLMIVL